MASRQLPSTPLTPPMNTKLRRFAAFSPSPMSSEAETSGLMSETSDDSMPSTPITPVIAGMPLSPPQQKNPAKTVVSGLNVGLELGALVGRGAFSNTYRGVDPRTGQIYAVKRRRKTTDVAMFSHERDILLVVSPHANIVRFHPRFSISQDYLVFDLYDTDLAQYMRQLQRDKTAVANSGSIDELFAFQRALTQPLPGLELWKTWVEQMIGALRHLRACRVIHGDIKPDNVLVRNSGRDIVLADFSSAQFAVPRGQEGVVACSQIYSAPEVRYGGSPSFGSDIYSCGLLLAFCAAGEEPYCTAKNPQQRMVWMDRVHPLDAYDPESQGRLTHVKPVLNMFLNRAPVEEILHSVQ